MKLLSKKTTKNSNGHSNGYHGKKIQGSAKKTRGLSKRINLEEDARRVAALTLIIMGKSVKFTASRTHLTLGQVSYLYREVCGLRVGDLRNGTKSGQYLSEGLIIQTQDSILTLLKRWLLQKEIVGNKIRVYSDDLDIHRRINGHDPTKRLVK
jgi:hypothetical protein